MKGARVARKPDDSLGGKVGTRIFSGAKKNCRKTKGNEQTSHLNGQKGNHDWANI